MLDAQYRALHASLNSLENCRAIAETSGVQYDTLLSIYCQKYRAAALEHNKLHRRHKHALGHLRRFERGESLLSIARSIPLPPCLLARIVLTSMEGVTGGKKEVVSRFIKSPADLPDPRLRKEVAECAEADFHFSPIADRTRHMIGIEYEVILEQTLRNLGIPFATEGDLRREGHPKTPDIKLNLPIGVHGRIINWIDSKAFFGDPSSVDGNADQLRGYVNRFGPGLVIYWFDFVEDTKLEDEDILVLSSFPTEFVTLS